MPNNTLYAYKALQMSYKSYFNQQEPLNKNPFNQSKLAKMEKPKKPKKNEKNRKKPVPNLKFAVAFGFFWVATPPPPPHILNFKAGHNQPCQILRDAKIEHKPRTGISFIPRSSVSRLCRTVKFIILGSSCVRGGVLAFSS